MEKIFAQLNDAQQEAVKTIDGPMLILAGAGSGKTKTITSRLAYLLDVVGIPPSATLTLTFTNKAANEMRERALSMIESEYHPPLLCTFHKFGLLFLKFHIHKLDRKNNFVVIDGDDRKRIIKRLNDELPTGLISSEISKYKNSLISVKEAYEKAQSEHYEIIAKVYDEYETYLQKNNLVDFDDLLALPYRILEEDTTLAETTSSQYQYIMIDEYQDTNELQLKLLKKLCSTHNNICVVGDDDQSIYGWRGAHIRNILEFDQDFEGAHVVKLEHNYRSHQKILNAANALIEHNRQRRGKKLIATRGEGDEVQEVVSNDEIEEAATIASKIQKLLDSGVRASEIAIVYRINALSRSIEEGLNRARIAYKLVGGLRFYDRMEIKDVISYLRVISNVNDDFSLKRIINKPKRGIGKSTVEKIEKLAEESSSSMFAVLDKLNKADLEALVKKKNAKTLKTFVKNIKTLKDEAERSAYDFIELFEELSEIKKSYEGLADHNEKLFNIDEFYGLYRDFIKQNPDLTLEDFLNEQTLKSEQDNVEGESIYIMSIHASKGLEFEHLYIIGMEEKFLPLVGEGSDLEEERRLCYVAFTRAKNTLTLSHVKRRFYKGQREDLMKSRFFNEAGLCEGSLIVEKKSTFKKNDLVRHKVFGVGRIQSISKAGKEHKLSINFGGNQREILASFVERL